MTLQEYKNKYILWTEPNGIIFDHRELNTSVERENYKTDPSECFPTTTLVDLWEDGNEGEKIDLVLYQLEKLEIKFINSDMEIISCLEYSNNLKI